MRGRILRVLGAATLLVALFAGGVTAGGWATITADPGNGQPTEGQPVTIGFTVLQHGVTPAGWVTPRLVAVRDGTGERVVADATGEGADGHFVATITLPKAGAWTWRIELSELEVEMTPVAVAVAGPDGAAAGANAAAGLADLQTTVTALQADVARLRGETQDGLPLVAVIAISALAGGIAGFGMVALGRSAAGAGRGGSQERAATGAGIRPAGQGG